MKFQYIFAAVFATVAMAAPAAESPATPSVRTLTPGTARSTSLVSTDGFYRCLRLDAPRTEELALVPQTAALESAPLALPAGLAHAEPKFNIALGYLNKS